MNGYESVNRVPPCFYRTPEQIKDDIRQISARISEVNEMLNIRELLADFLDDEPCVDVVERAEELSELIAFAAEALDELRSLNATLDQLKAELIQTISEIGW